MYRPHIIWKDDGQREDGKDALWKAIDDSRALIKCLLEWQEELIRKEIVRREIWTSTLRAMRLTRIITMPPVTASRGTRHREGFSDA